MRDTQPPIANEQEYYGYSSAREKMTALVEEREQALLDALHSGDKEYIEDCRYALFRAIGKRLGILDAIRTYEQQKQQSA